MSPLGTRDIVLVLVIVVGLVLIAALAQALLG